MIKTANNTAAAGIQLEEHQADAARKSVASAIRNAGSMVSRVRRGEVNGYGIQTRDYAVDNADCAIGRAETAISSEWNASVVTDRQRARVAALRAELTEIA